MFRASASLPCQLMRLVHQRLRHAVEGAELIQQHVPAGDLRMPSGGAEWSTHVQRSYRSCGLFD